MELLIGYGGITICGYINSVLALVLQRHPFLILIAFICYISCAIIYLIFIAEHLPKYQVPPPHPIELNCCGLMYFLLGIIEFAVIGYLLSSFMGLISAVLVGEASFVFVKMEFLAIIFNGVRLKDTPAPVNYSVSRNSLSDQLCDSRSPSPYEFDSDDEELRVPRTVIAGRISPESVVITVVSSSNASDCNICLLQYSNHVIPRILVGCGHTFCQICIAKLPKSGARVTCPLCRIFTTLPYCRADLLPKNFTVMDMIQERNL
ncbi:unnamed protein product [Caenorhabditis brenneri]